MGLFDKVRSWSTPKPSNAEADAKKELYRIIESALDVSEAYSDCILRNSTTPTFNLSILRPETDLPFSKEQIIQKTNFLLKVIRTPETRAVIVEYFEPVQAQYMLSAKYEDALRAGLVYLDRFVPAEQANAEAKQFEEALALLEKTDPVKFTQLKKNLMNK